jgi:hypothetical protein
VDDRLGNTQARPLRQALVVGGPGAGSGHGARPGGSVEGQESRASGRPEAQAADGDPAMTGGGAGERSAIGSSVAPGKKNPSMRLEAMRSTA